MASPGLYGSGGGPGDGQAMGGHSGGRPGARHDDPPRREEHHDRTIHGPPAGRRAEPRQDRLVRHRVGRPTRSPTPRTARPGGSIRACRRRHHQWRNRSGSCARRPRNGRYASSVTLDGNAPCHREWRRRMRPAAPRADTCRRATDSRRVVDRQCAVPRRAAPRRAVERPTPDPPGGGRPRSSLRRGRSRGCRPGWHSRSRDRRRRGPRRRPSRPARRPPRPGCGRR